MESDVGIGIDHDLTADCEIGDGAGSDDNFPVHRYNFGNNRFIADGHCFVFIGDIVPVIPHKDSADIQGNDIAVHDRDFTA